MEQTEALRGLVQSSLAIELPAGINREELTQQLTIYFNHLIQSDFHRLVTLLYRIDIDENKLRRLLSAHPDTDAGRLIAGLFIDRQLQKLASREAFRQQSPGESEEEKW